MENLLNKISSDRLISWMNGEDKINIIITFNKELTKQQCIKELDSFRQIYQYNETWNHYTFKVYDCDREMVNKMAANSNVVDLFDFRYC